MTDTRCTWSDLPTNTCDHCGPAHPATSTERTAARTKLISDATTGRYEPTRPQLRVVHPVAYQGPTTTPPAGPPRSILGDHPDTLIDYIAALTQATIHHEPYSQASANSDGSTTWIHLRHRTVSPPLLEQLLSAVEQSGTVEGGRRSFESKPSARIDAIAAATGIEDDTYSELARLGVTDAADKYPHLIGAVTHLGSLAVGRLCQAAKGKRASVDEATAGWCCDGHGLEALVRGWWAQARVLTGWDSPAWKPANSCPLCGVKGGLRVRLDGHTAVCVECRETWTPETIGLLADHIREENHEDDDQQEGDHDQQEDADDRVAG